MATDVVLRFHLLSSTVVICYHPIMRNIRVALAQINCMVGDLAGNYNKICRYIKDAGAEDAALLIFPELALTGYPPEDLLLKPGFIDDNLKYLQKIVQFSQDFANPAIVVGFVDRDEDKIYNGAAVIAEGKIYGIYHKIMLPNYGVFDEKRYFTAGDGYPVFTIGGVRVGVNICEDIWHAEGPAKTQALCGNAEFIANINASPYHQGKGRFREELAAKRARQNHAVVAYVNMVGGQDELVFDGHSLIFDADGKLIGRGRQFAEELIIADVPISSRNKARQSEAAKKFIAAFSGNIDDINVSETFNLKNNPYCSRIADLLAPLAEVCEALKLGVADYAGKNNFKKVLVGLSGGIDSALTAVIAADALGADNVEAVFMPSVFTSVESREDAAALAANVGFKLSTVPIDNTFTAYKNMLKEAFAGTELNITEENLQARIRGNILMAISNKFGHLVLSTGNKSEMSVGYATLYGDMSGGFAVLKDVPKTLVYQLARERNQTAGFTLIPKRILTKEPTAELRADQKDTDSLPPYEVLDPILKAYVEEDKSLAEIVSLGFAEDMVKKIIGLVDRSEYKRRQAAPGVKITIRAFGKDRRLPITNGYGG